MKTNAATLDILVASFKKGDTGSAVQLLKRGVDTPEIKTAVRQHKNGNPLKRVYEEYKKAPQRVCNQYNPDSVRFHSGQYAGRDIICNMNTRNVAAWLDTMQPAPEGLMKKALADADFVAKKWMKALVKATDMTTANFVVNGHYVHHTTQKIILQLALLGYRPKVVSIGNGEFIRLGETYGELRYEDVVQVCEHIDLAGSEPYLPVDQAILFGSSGSKNSWKMREDGKTLDVTCWH